MQKPREERDLNQLFSLRRVHREGKVLVEATRANGTTFFPDGRWLQRHAFRSLKSAKTAEGSASALYENLGVEMRGKPRGQEKIRKPRRRFLRR